MTNYLQPYDGSADDSQELNNSQPHVGSLTDKVEFNVNDFDSLIDKNGIKTVWEQSYRCPCFSTLTKSPNPNCPYCHGTGWAYLPAVNNVPIVIQKNNKGYTNGKYGVFDTGTTQATVKRNFHISARDRISVPEFTVRQQFMFNVTQDRVDNGMRIPYDVKNILYIAYMSSNNLIVQMEQGKDYSYDNDKDVIKVSNNLLNKNVTILMNVTMRFIVLNVEKELRYQYTERNMPSKKFDELPRLLSLKREEVFVNNMPLISPTDNTIMTKAYEDQSMELKVASKEDKGFGL